MSSDLDIVRCNSIDSLQSSDTGFSSFESDEDEDANFKVGHALLRNFRLNVTEALQSFSNLRRHSLTFAAAALVPTMSIVLQQRLELTDAIADIEARIKMRMMPGGDAARRGSDAEMNAIVQHVKVILAHHDAYWDLDPDAPDWHRKFATKVLGVLLESLRIAKMWNERLARFESEMNEAKVIRALYQLKVIEALELRGEQNLYIHEMKLQDRLEGHHGQSLETRTRDQKGAALFVALGACICAFLFLLQFGRVSGKSQMQLWVWGSVFSLVLILFVFESIRILMIWFYVPSLLIPRLSHIGDPLTMSVPRFRMTLAVQPADIVDSRLVLQVMRSPLVPDEVKQTFRQRFYHSQRMSSNQRQRYASMMSDLASTFEVVSDKTMWRKANEHYCLFGCDDSLSRLLDAAALVCECELDHQESDHRLVNRAYREANAKRWELAHLESVAHALRWRPPLSLNAQTFLTAMILNTSDDIQDLVIEEATNIAAFSFIYFIGRVSAGPTQFRHTIGASAVLLVAFIIVFLCCLWASRIALVPLAISAKKRVVRYCRRGNQPEIELSDSSETGDNESEKWSDDKSETSESDDEICVMESSSFDGATIHIEDEIQGSQKLILKSTFLSAISELNENGQAIDDDIWDVGDGYDSPTEDDDEILEKAPSRLEPSATVLWETPSDDVDESSVSTVSADKNVRAFVPSRRCSNESNWYLESVMGYSVLRRLDTIEEEEEEEDDEDGDLMSVLGSDNSERRFDDDVHNVFQFEEEGEVVDDEALTLDPFWHDDDDVEEEDDGPPIQSSRMDSVSLPDDDGGAEDDDDCQPQSPRLDSCSCEDEDDGVVDDINQRTDSPLMMDFTLPNDDDCVEGDDDRQPQLRRRDSLLLDNDGAEGGVNWQAQRSSHSCLADDDGAEDGDCVEDDDAAKDEVDDDDDDSQPLSRHSDSCLSKDDDDADYDGDGDVDRQTQMPHLDSLDSSCSHNDGGVEADREPQSPRVDSLLLENHSTDKNLQARRSSHLDCYLPDDDGVEEDDEDWQPRSPRFESGGPDAENDEDSQAPRFEGARPQYVFTTRDEGTGYYLEERPVSREAKRVKFDEAAIEAEEVAAIIRKGEEVEVREVDSEAVKRLLLQLEKKMLVNRQLRVKYVDEPRRFVDSEVDLDEAIKQSSLLAAAPELYGVVVACGGCASIASLLSHENGDVRASACGLLYDLTEVDDGADAASVEGTRVLSKALVESEVVELLGAALERFDETTEESQGTHDALGVFEHLLSEDVDAVRPEAAFASCGAFLVRRVKKPSFDANKLYASEVLAILLQRSEGAARALAAAEDEAGANGVDALLQACNYYRKRSPGDGDEDECLENIFDALFASLAGAPATNVPLFVEAEGVELMLRCAKEGRRAAACALKVLDAALSSLAPSNDAACAATRLVDAGGLKIVFPALMGKGPARGPRLRGTKKRAKRRADDRRDCEERVLSILASLCFYATPAAPRDAQARLVAKFKEPGKIPRLAHLAAKFSEDLGNQRRQEADLPVNDDDPDRLKSHARLLRAGGHALRLVAVALAFSLANSPACRASLRDNTLKPSDLVHLLAEFAAELDDQGKDHLDDDDDDARAARRVAALRAVALRDWAAALAALD
ncbi:hypothetical protein CTAYLR_006105 [Chrysophaeum taylorii]|uniref:Beta-catenin-like protein 1 N-terminal domain-containing protein n=1 Tax=Chrysophaeum taylorii TaxID=2483200 RepID=A0AAD7XJL7_9STRA|nr:hypothetical protein CTAYLR_006105 [Chrysophaeum taylorii]